LLAPIARAMLEARLCDLLLPFISAKAYDKINKKYKIPEEFKALKDANKKD
jgi:hypothetical protein